MDRLEKIKNGVLNKIKIEYIVIVFVVLFLVYVLMGGINIKGNSSKNVLTETELTETEKYAKSIEERLEKCLSKIDKVGKISVTVTLSGSVVTEYLTDTVTYENSTDKKTTSTSVTVNGNPVVKEIIYPKISNILVLTKNSKNIKLRLDIITAIKACYDIDSKNIEILEIK